MWIAAAPRSPEVFIAREMNIAILTYELNERLALIDNITESENTNHFKYKYEAGKPEQPINLIK